METKLHLFTKGPIPYWWSYRANQLGTATGVIAQSLWFYVGMTGSYTVKLDRNIDLLSGITRQSRQRCLKRLHNAGLIKLDLLKGAYPIVTLLDVGNAGRRNQAPTPTNLETKTFDALAKAGTGPNLRETNFQKQGYSHEKKRHLASANQESDPEDVLQRIPLARWIKDPQTWDKYTFINEASQYLWDAYGSSTEQDKHALGMLAEVLETFVTCCKEIAANGLVVTHHNGVTGKNHHVDIRDKAITKAVLLMNELGLTPKSRFPLKPKPNPEFERFMRGPYGWSNEPKEPFDLDSVLGKK